MKNRAIEILAFVLGLLTTVAAVLTLPQVALLPESFQPYLGLGLALVMVGKNGAYVILDFADNGKLDKSYKLPPGLPVLALAGLCLLTLPSCSTDPDGARRFAGLRFADWGAVGQAAGRGAVQSGLPAYLERRQASSGKSVEAVYAEDLTRDR